MFVRKAPSSTEVDLAHGGGDVAGYAGRALEGPASPYGLLRAGLDAGPDGLALISGDTRWTWRTLDDLSDRLAAGLLALGLNRGDRVASLMPNRPALIVYYLACFKAGLVATPLNYRYMAPEIDHALTISKARALLAHAEREEDLAASRLARQLPLGTISYGRTRGAGPSFYELIEGQASSRLPPPPSPAAPAVIFFTSGSTGRPKGVTHTHQTLGWMFAIGAAGLEFSPGDLLLAGSSLSHLGAFYLSFAALSAGASVIVARTFDGDELLPLLREAPPDGAVDASFGAVRADPRPRRPARRFRLAAAVPRGGRHRLGGAGAGVHRAERVCDRRGLWPDGSRAGDGEPAVRSDQARFGRAGRPRGLAVNPER